MHLQNVNILSHLIIPLFNRHFYQEDCDKKKYFKRLKWQWWQELTLEKHVYLKYQWKHTEEGKKSLQPFPSLNRYRHEVKQEPRCPSHWPAEAPKACRLLPRGFAALYGRTLQLQVALHRGRETEPSPGTAALGTAAKLSWQLDLDLTPGL